MSNPRFEHAFLVTGDEIDEAGRQWIEVLPTAENAKNGPWYFTISLGTTPPSRPTNISKSPVSRVNRCATMRDKWRSLRAAIMTLTLAIRRKAPVQGPRL